MLVTLHVVRGSASRPEVSVELPSVIGRSREAQLRIAHPMVSRRHCELYQVDGLLMVRDLGSLNGTWVGGRRVVEAPLPPGGEIEVGPLAFHAEYDYAGDASDVPPAKLDLAAEEGAEAAAQAAGGPQVEAETPYDPQSVDAAIEVPPQVFLAQFAAAEAGESESPWSDVPLGAADSASGPPQGPDQTGTRPRAEESQSTVSEPQKRVPPVRHPPPDQPADQSQPPPHRSDS
jgi:predicted component of type VI protein secretion system